MAGHCSQDWKTELSMALSKTPEYFLDIIGCEEFIRYAKKYRAIGHRPEDLVRGYELSLVCEAVMMDFPLSAEDLDKLFAAARAQRQIKKI